ncbi:MAG: ribbon-helix-helix protein, CopG family [Thermoleophilaceae bacterium]|nr:ribbon-helix-helix protein, CopG family [Thermoleophilaceae bacterium]
MARTQTMVQLSVDLVDALDRAAADRDRSRSALIRELLWEALSSDRERAIGEEIAEGYRRIPQGEHDEWGDLGAAAEGGHRRTLRRLDAEERAAGHEPW